MTYREVIGVAEEAPPLVLDWDCRPPTGGPTTPPPAPLASLHTGKYIVHSDYFTPPFF